MFSQPIFNIALLIGEVVLLYTLGRMVNQYLVYLIINTGKWQAMPLHILYAPGVTMHETSHAIVAKIFGGRIDRFVPYHPQQDEDGQGLLMGYVQYSMPSNNPITGFLIGIAPLIGVPLLLFGLGELIVPGANFSQGLISVVGPAFSSIAAHPFAVGTIGSYVFLYLLLSGSLGLLPSASDHRDLIPFMIFLVIIVGIVLLVGHGSTDFSFLLPAVKFLGQLLLPPSLVTLLLYHAVTSRKN